MTSVETPSPEFSDGRPISARDPDRLAHNPLVNELAAAIRLRSPKNGFVIGIEGPWGCGKSSIANLLEATLTADKKSRQRVVRFSPWVVGSRDQLIGELFADLIRAAADLGSPYPAKWHDLRQSWKAFRQCWRLRKLKATERQWFSVFGEFSARLGQLGAVGIALGIIDPVTGILSLAGVVGQSASAASKPKSLLEIKSEIDDALSALSGRLVIIIDDLDRLEPSEAVEVLRLIRAVADFANVTYVLCYDREVLASALKSQLGVADGDEFLQKVVQLPFRVPHPESFRLRGWFNEEMERKFGPQLQALQTHDDREGIDRLASTIDVYGGRYLQTPRNIILTLNTLALFAPALAGKVDFPDLVWISLVKHGNPALFKWIERYVSEVAALANGAGITEGEREKSRQELHKILTESSVDPEYEMNALETYLPGLRHEVVPNKQWIVFNSITRQNLRRHIAQKRLGSPDHYREYFAFSHPEGSISGTDVASFSEQLERDPVAAKMTFQAASEGLIAGQIVRAERLLEQVMASNKLSEKQLAVLVECIADSLDDAARTGPPDAWMGTRVWHTAERILRSILSKLSQSQRMSLLKDAFSNGHSLGFLMDFFRHETLAHGVYGDRPKPETEWAITQLEFEEITINLRNRLLNARPEILLSTPELLSLLFGWRQIGGVQEAKDKVTEITASDDQLLSFLSACRSFSARPGRMLRPLRRQELENFLDVDIARKRLSEIARDTRLTEHKRAHATSLIEAFDHADI